MLGDNVSIAQKFAIDKRNRVWPRETKPSTTAKPSEELKATTFISYDYDARDPPLYRHNNLKVHSLNLCITVE